MHVFELDPSRCPSPGHAPPTQIVRGKRCRARRRREIGERFLLATRSRRLAAALNSAMNSGARAANRLWSSQLPSAALQLGIRGERHLVSVHCADHVHVQFPGLRVAAAGPPIRCDGERWRPRAACATLSMSNSPVIGNCRCRPDQVAAIICRLSGIFWGLRWPDVADARHPGKRSPSAGSSYCRRSIQVRCCTWSTEVPARLRWHDSDRRRAFFWASACK